MLGGGALCFSIEANIRLFGDWIVPGEAVSASNSNVFEEEDIEDCSFVKGTVAQMSYAMEKKNHKQEQNTMKTMK